MKNIINNDETVYEKFFKNREKYEPLVFFGAGAGAHDAIEMFESENANLPVAICDNDKTKWGAFIGNIPILSFGEIQSRFNDCYILVTAPANAHYIIPQLEKLIDKEKILFFTKYEQNEIEKFREFVNNNTDKIEDVYINLSDQFSRETFEAVLKARNSGECEYYKSIFHDTQYFADDIFTLENETFLDVGAFNGDTIKKFMQKSHYKYDGIVGLEPHPVLFEELQKFTVEYSNVTIFNVAAGKKTEKLFIDTDERDFSKTNVSNVGTVEVKVVKIDDIMNQDVTLIKMDIEGFEMQALEGAVQTIKRCKPKLAICLYHKYTDLVDIQMFLTDLNLGYKFYMRHHTYYMGETVLYAICN